MQNKSVYAASNPKLVQFNAIDKNLECEVCIVGGGLAGLSLAYQLAQQGQNFILIESKKIGDCASGINGGFCSPGWSVDSDTLLRQVGTENAKTFYNISIEGLNWVRSFRDRNGFESMDFKAGTVGLSLLKSETDARADFLKRDFTFQKEYQFISKKELINFVDSPAYQSGILSKSGFSFNPLSFLIGLKGSIELIQSNSIYEESKMQSFSESNDSCQINLTNGYSIRAQKLVIATGGYGGSETSYLRTRWLPITTSILVTSSLSEGVKEIINPKFAFSDDRRAGNYFRLISDNRLLWGRGIHAVRSPNREDLKKSTIKDIKKFFPGILDMCPSGSLHFELGWSGEMAYSRSKMPYVRRLTARTYALTGFGGHGMNTAPAAAILLAEHLLGLSNRISIFKKIPLKWNGGRFGPVAAEIIYRVMAAKDTFNQTLLSMREK